MPDRLHVVDGLARDVARVAAVVFLGERVLDVADQSVSVVSLEERVDERGLGLRHDEHVGLVDRLPAADAGAVEAEAVLEGRFFEHGGRDGEMLPQAGEVHEAQVDGLDFLFTDERKDFFRGHCVNFSLGEGGGVGDSPEFMGTGALCSGGHSGFPLAG